MDSQQAKLLLVDDNKTNLELMKVILEEEGYYIVTASNAAEAMRKLKRDNFDLVITDFLMPPGKNGLELTEDIKKFHSQTEVIIITAYGDIENAVKAIKMQAHDFLQRPINNDLLLLKVKKALENRMLSVELEKVKKIFKDELESHHRIVGNSHAVKNLIEKVKVIATTDSPLLVTGESGVGKELFARTIHNLSSRKDHHFISLNCGAMPGDLLERELFGYKKNAFPGFNADKTGLFQEADLGTLYLEEINNIPLNFQVKLLKVIQEGEFYPIGSDEPIKVNTRIIAASNKELKEAIEKEEFRKDLYYRLNVISLEITPLRERKEDIPVLANYFIAKYSQKYSKRITGFSDNAISYMIKYSWPGNVTELENIVERAVILSHEEIID
ncbi:MAG: hypothetical protein CVV50_04445, partial [Spirochaetae bacterium HGW-Spirochaetae-6]